MAAEESGNVVAPERVHVQRRLSRPEIEALVAGDEAGDEAGQANAISSFGCARRRPGSIPTLLALLD